jgi:hypothetical protein
MIRSLKPSSGGSVFGFWPKSPTLMRRSIPTSQALSGWAEATAFGLSRTRTSLVTLVRFCYWSQAECMFRSAVQLNYLLDGPFQIDSHHSVTINGKRTINE